MIMDKRPDWEINTRDYDMQYAAEADPSLLIWFGE
jgi:hypothetical protein